MSSDILALIDGWSRAKDLVAAHEKRIIEIICDAIRGIIPDIEGWVGDAENPNLLFFNSETWSKDFSTNKEAAVGWMWFSSVIEDVFPELKNKTYDNGIYLPPEEQGEILERLKKLRGSVEGGKR